MSRYVLYPENEAKVQAAVKRLREEHGVTISANRYLNILSQIADTVEVVQEVSVTIKTAPTPEQPKKPRKTRVQQRSRWIDEYTLPRG
jgi:hypothetical protein